VETDEHHLQRLRNDLGPGNVDHRRRDIRASDAREAIRAEHGEQLAVELPHLVLHAVYIREHPLRVWLRVRGVQPCWSAHGVLFLV
jgi:hypothetical protein